MLRPYRRRILGVIVLSGVASVAEAVALISIVLLAGSGGAAGRATGTLTRQFPSTPAGLVVLGVVGRSDPSRRLQPG